MIEHRVTERMIEDSEYPLLNTNSRANAFSCTGTRERERDGEPDKYRDDDERSNNTYRDKTRR